VRELAELDSLQTALSEHLVEYLYALVPSVADPAQRRPLLAVKRAVFNGRPLPGAASKLRLPDDVAATLLERYEELQQRRHPILSTVEDTVWDESCRSLAERVIGADFRLAVVASSATLAGALDRSDKTDEIADERDQRSLYAYVCRFATKANPLHLFA